MKHSIQWHKEMLTNLKISATQRQKEAARICREVERITQAVAFLTRQIETAEKSGKESFDAERYLIKSSLGGLRTWKPQ